MARLVSHDWPGNVRELANVLERAQILAEGTVITADDLPDSVVGAAPAAAPNPAAPFDLDAVERNHVAEVLAKMKGNKLQTAKALGISRRALYRLIDKHGLAPKAEKALEGPEPIANPAGVTPAETSPTGG
jgi:transcriptional regulator of acetoin/glycerol metabolism